MRGVDISNWQRGLVPSSLGVEFCICKATEGTTYVDNTCDGFVQDCISNNILWGIYHFAGGGNPEDEARFFYDACVNYFGHGIPVLDFEVDARECSNVEFCERFLSTLHDLSGVWAMLYISASRTIDYIGSWIPEKCGLWVAGYPWYMTTWPDDESLPYSVNPWAFAAIWQFSSSLRLASYDGNLDGDIAYMDADAWARYATPDIKPVDDSAKRKSIDKLAREVIAGNVIVAFFTRPDPFRRSLTAYKGYLTHQETSGIQGKPWVPPEVILGIADRKLDPAPQATVTVSENYYPEFAGQI